MLLSIAENWQQVLLLSIKSLFSSLSPQLLYHSPSYWLFFVPILVVVDDVVHVEWTLFLSNTGFSIVFLSRANLKIHGPVVVQVLYSECSTKHTRRNLSKILVLFLPNRILVFKMFNRQKTSCVSTSIGRGPKLSGMNTNGPFLHLCRCFLSSFL